MYLFYTWYVFISPYIFCVYAHRHNEIDMVRMGSHFYKIFTAYLICFCLISEFLNYTYCSNNLKAKTENWKTTANWRSSWYSWLIYLNLWQNSWIGWVCAFLKKIRNIKLGSLHKVWYNHKNSGLPLFPLVQVKSSKRRLQGLDNPPAVLYLLPF